MLYSEFVKPVWMMGLCISMSAADDNVYMSYQHGFWMSDRLLLEPRWAARREQEFLNMLFHLQPD